MWSWRRPMGPARPTATRRRAGRAAARAGRGRPLSLPVGGLRPGEAASAAGPGAAVQGGRRCSAGPGARPGASVGSCPGGQSPLSKPREWRGPGGPQRGSAGGDSHGPHTAGCGSCWVCDAVPVCPSELPRPPCTPGLEHPPVTGVSLKYSSHPVPRGRAPSPVSGERVLPLAGKGRIKLVGRGGSRLLNLLLLRHPVPLVPGPFETCP